MSYLESNIYIDPETQQSHTIPANEPVPTYPVTALNGKVFQASTQTGPGVLVDNGFHMRHLDDRGDVVERIPNPNDAYTIAQKEQELRMLEEQLRRIAIERDPQTQENMRLMEAFAQYSPPAREFFVKTENGPQRVISLSFGQGLRDDLKPFSIGNTVEDRLPQEQRGLAHSTDLDTYIQQIYSRSFLFTQEGLYTLRYWNGNVDSNPPEITPFVLDQVLSSEKPGDVLNEKGVRYGVSLDQSPSGSQEKVAKLLAIKVCAQRTNKLAEERNQTLQSGKAFANLI